MLAKWEVKEIITQALEALDGMLSEPDYEIGKCVPSRKYLIQSQVDNDLYNIIMY